MAAQARRGVRIGRRTALEQAETLRAAPRLARRGRASSRSAPITSTRSTTATWPHRRVRAANAPSRCIFITQPHGYGPAADAAYRASFWMTPAFADYTLDLDSLAHIAALYNRHLLVFGAAEGIPVCDAASQFEPSFRYFYDDLHLNAAGAEHMAEVLAPCVAAALRRD